MAMFLSGVCKIIIQRVGRWSSFAFLEYIREQVDCFTVGVSQKMLEHEDFYHLNEKESEKIVRKTKLGPRKERGEDDIPFDVSERKVTHLLEKRAANTYQKCFVQFSNVIFFQLMTCFFLSRLQEGNIATQEDHFQASAEATIT